MKLQFSLLSLVLLLTATAIVSALVFQIPPGHFPFDVQTGPSDHMLTYRELGARLVVCASLVAMELTGILLVVREYRRTGTKPPIDPYRRDESSLR